jgi:hypothetical protein
MVEPSGAACKTEEKRMLLPPRKQKHGCVGQAIRFPRR